MKRAILLLCILFSVTVYSQERKDTLYFCDGRIEGVDITVNYSDRLEFRYPGESMVNVLEKTDFIKIVFKSGRLEILRTVEKAPERATVHNEDGQLLSYALQSDKIANCMLVGFGFSDDSMTNDGILEASFVPVKFYYTATKKTKKLEHIKLATEPKPKDGDIYFDYDEEYGLIPILTNKSDQTIYIDKANSFCILDGAPSSYYSGKTVTNTRGVAHTRIITDDFFDAIISYGNTFINQTSETTVEQRYLVLPPHSVAALTEQNIGRQIDEVIPSIHKQLKEYGCQYKLKVAKLMIGEHYFVKNEEADIRYVFAYGFSESGSSQRKISMSIVPKEVMGYRETVMSVLFDKENLSDESVLTVVSDLISK